MAENWWVGNGFVGVLVKEKKYRPFPPGKKQGLTKAPIVGLHKLFGIPFGSNREILVHDAVQASNLSFRKSFEGGFILV